MPSRPNRTCEHVKDKQYCRKCNGSAFCSHGKYKKRCKICSGTSYCNHGKRKDICIICTPSAFCIHKKRKYYCKLCKGSGICKHNKVTYHCVICNGGGICEHQRNRNSCSLCGNGMCPQCGLYSTGGKRLCYLCNPLSARRKIYDKNRAEMKLVEFLSLKLGDKSLLMHNKAVGIACDYTIRPDVVIKSKTGKHVIVIECDEKAHSSNKSICEWSRIFNLYDIYRIPILFFRWNPDHWKVANESQSVRIESRLEKLWSLVNPFYNEDESSANKIEVYFLYYPTRTSNPVVKLSQDEIDEKLNLFRQPIKELSIFSHVTLNNPNTLKKNEW